MLHMKMAAQKERDPPLVHELLHLLAMLDGTIALINAALVQQIVVGRHDHIAAFLPFRIHPFFQPLVCLRADHSAYVVAVLILAAVQHQEPRAVVQLVDIA